MKMFRPGFAPVITDEPGAPKAKAKNPLPSVAEAMRQAAARQTQVLGYTGASKENPSKGVVDTSSGPHVPHAINDRPEPEVKK
jgi:hypothetical protein